MTLMASEARRTEGGDAMPRAILKDGVIYPIEPLPPEWADGRELVIEEAKSEAADRIDRCYDEIEAIAAGMDPRDDERLMRAVAQVRREAKEVARREMGLR
jgi:hypothetical protein